MNNKAKMTLFAASISAGLMTLITGTGLLLKQKITSLEPDIPEVPPETALLFQFDYSPYCVKARYCLEFKQVDYQTVELTPLLHSAFSQRFSGQRKVPYIQHQGKIITDSTDIALYLDETYPTPPLFPPDPQLREEILLLEDWIDEALQPALARLAYLHYYHHPETVINNSDLKTGMPLLEPLKPWLTPPMIRRAMFKMGVGPNDRKRLEARLWEIMERLKARLKDKDYLVGSQLSLADLSLASALSVVDRLPWLAEHPKMRWLLDWRTVILNEIKDPTSNAKA